jgi:hypothetical protein
MWDWIPKSYTHAFMYIINRFTCTYDILTVLVHILTLLYDYYTFNVLALRKRGGGVIGWV